MLERYCFRGQSPFSGQSSTSMVPVLELNIGQYSEKKLEYIIILLNALILKVHDDNYISGRMKLYLKNLMNFTEFLSCYYVDFYLDDTDTI